MAMNDALQRAEGFLELGMHLDAWKATEELPPAERGLPATIALRVRICTALANWEMGDTLAAVLRDSPEDAHRETVARFHHAHAKRHCRDGRFDTAKEQVALAVDAWPEIRGMLLPCPSRRFFYPSKVWRSIAR